MVGTPTGAGLKVYSISLMIHHGSQASTLSQFGLAPAWSPKPLLQASLPDRLGRRRVLIFNYLQTAVSSGSVPPSAPNFPVHCAFRPFLGHVTSWHCPQLHDTEQPWRAGRAPPFSLQPPSPTAPFQPPLQSPLALSSPVPCSQHNSLRPGAHTSLAIFFRHANRTNSIVRARQFWLNTKELRGQRVRRESPKEKHTHPKGCSHSATPDRKHRYQTSPPPLLLATNIPTC